MSRRTTTTSYYQRAAATTRVSVDDKMTSRLYGKDLREYDDVDIETLLAKLSAEELEELNNEVDPDNSLLPPSARCRDQTEKEPTGPFKREELLDYLEDSAKKEKDWDERVPFELGVKRGKEYVAPDVPTIGYEDGEEIAIELDIDDEFEEAMSTATERDLVDLAGILGMHSMLSQAQYYNALKGKPQDDGTGNFCGIVQATIPKLLPEEPPNDTDVEDAIDRLNSNDPSMTELNINNMKRIPKERIVALIDAAKDNMHLEKFSMANTAVTDKEARGLVQVVQNSRSLTTLNVESNFLSPDLLAQLLRATLSNQSIVQFHAENQRAQVLGNQIEMDMMQSIEENDTLLRVGVAFQSMEARHRVSEALERNYERLRLRRIEG